MLKRDDFARGGVDDRWLDGVLAERTGAAAQAVVLLGAAAEAYEADHERAKAAFFAAAARGRPARSRHRRARGL